ncbi:MAG TPA: PDZ domain-containing protein [Sedimenticola sp.]|nr:PDZ domain-containing protein [Sedimenticola sp.]
MMTRKIPLRFLFPLLVLPFLSACQAVEVNARAEKGASPHGLAAAQQVRAHQGEETRVLDLRQSRELKQIIPLLAEKRVVYVGETHDQYSHHLTQLEIIRELYRRNPDLAIGLEFFQWPFQPALDRYIAGETGETGLLQESEWYDRWIYDYRLYRPIIAFAREKGIPLVALNVPKELVARVSSVGLAGLDEAERAKLPAEIDSGDQAYRQRLKKVFQRHAGMSGKRFDRFVEVQLLWDEGMARSVADYLKAHPGRRMVVLAGSGHLMFGSGIPNRVNRRLPVTSAIVLPGDRLQLAPGIADFITYPGSEQLPPAGMMGIYLAEGAQGVRVGGLAPGSAAEQVGVRKGDLIRTLNGSDIQRVADIRIALLDKSPGDRVKLEVRRKGVLWGEDDLAFDITLGDPD